MAASLHGDIERTRRYITYGTLDPRAVPQTDACAAILGSSGPWPDDVGEFCEHPLLRRIFAEAPINEKERKACLASLKALADLARGIPVGEFLGRLTLIVTKSIEMHRSKEPVTLRILSIEASKGVSSCLWPYPLWREDASPASRHEEAYRERNMLYVAMTRARAALWLLEGRAKPVRPGPV